MPKPTGVVHFSEEDWCRTETNWSAWWGGELERPLLVLEGLERPHPQLPDAPGFVSNLPLDMPACDVVDRYEAHLSARRFYGDAFPKWWINFGPGVMAGFLGAKVISTPATVWFEPSGQWDIHELSLAYDPENAWWKRVRELTREAAERWEGQVAVAHTDLGGNLDILASLRGPEGLLLDLIEAPEEVERRVGEITQLWLRYYEELNELISEKGRGTSCWATVWSPLKTYMLQSDFAYMISPAMFERFVSPDIRSCCDFLDHAFYHLDGKGQIPHLDLLLDIPRLRGVQWIPGDGQPEPEGWLSLLKRIKDSGKLCQLYVSPAGAKRIVSSLGGKGFCLHIHGDFQAEEAEALLKDLAKEDKDLRKG